MARSRTLRVRKRDHRRRANESQMERRLRAAISANPDDDAPRLVYAARSGIAARTRAPRTGAAASSLARRAYLEQVCELKLGQGCLELVELYRLGNLNTAQDATKAARYLK
jgi:hypothetical protein